MKNPLIMTGLMLVRRNGTVRAFLLSVLVIFCTALTVLTATATTQPTSTPITRRLHPFGVMLPSFDELPNGLAVAENLGAASIRRQVTVETWDGTCEVCDAYTERGFQLLMTLKAQPQHRNTPEDIARGGPINLGSHLPEDMQAYKARVAEIIDATRPTVVAVENEPDGRMFWDDTPQNYLQLLMAACEVAHNKGVKCTDGGLTSGTVVIMVYQHYLNTRQSAKADSFRSRLNNRYTIPSDPEQRRARAEEGWTYLRGFKATGADHVNFHWYEHSASAFAEAVAYLQSEAGLPAMSNETGQLNEDGATTNGIMNEAFKLGLPHLIWFSFDWRADKEEEENARALQNPDGTLRPSGEAYKAFIREHFPSLPTPTPTPTPAPTPIPTPAPAPMLLTEENSTRAVALDSVTWMRDPFPLFATYNFSSDSRARIQLFALNLQLSSGEDYRAVSAEIEDSAGRIYPLEVEHVGNLTGFEFISCVIVKLPADLPETGDVQVRVKLRGVFSNSAYIGIIRPGG